MAKKKEFIEDEDLVILANKVIKEHKMDHLDGIRIKFVLVSPNISKTCAGKCIKPNAELKHYGDLDYLIEFSEDIWNGIKDETKEILMWHELRHILVTADKDGNTQYKILDHDIKDFLSIIDRHGVDWIEHIRQTANSIHDFQNGEQDKMKM